MRKPIVVAVLMFAVKTMARLLFTPFTFCTTAVTFGTLALIAVAMNRSYSRMIGATSEDTLTEMPGSTRRTTSRAKRSCTGFAYE